MAHDSFRFYRVSNTLRDIASEHLRQMRDEIARSRELLRGALPDTFLGRKSQGHFPTRTWITGRNGGAWRGNRSCRSKASSVDGL